MPELTEWAQSLFLLATLGCWYHLRQPEYSRAAAWGLVVGLTRPNGFLLGLPLGLIALGLRDATRADGAAPSVLISPWSTAGKVGRLQTAGSRESTSIHAPRRGLSLPALAVAAMPGAGLMLHSIWLYQQTGVWFAWAQVHAAWGRTVTAAVPEGALDAVLSGGCCNSSAITRTNRSTPSASCLLWPSSRPCGHGSVRRGPSTCS